MAQPLQNKIEREKKYISLGMNIEHTFLQLFTTKKNLFIVPNSINPKKIRRKKQDFYMIFLKILNLL